MNANCANYAHFTFEFYQINLCNSRNSRSKQIRPRLKLTTLGAAFPTIDCYSHKTKRTERAALFSHYFHRPNTSEVDYAFSESFIDLNGRFENGYRDTCMNALCDFRSRHARALFDFISADLYEFHFSASKLRKLLNIEGSYRRAASIKLILEFVRKEFREKRPVFDFLWCCESEWESSKKASTGRRNRGEDEKDKNKTFWFRVKGMGQYRVPKGDKSVILTDCIHNPEYRNARAFLNRQMKMQDDSTATTGSTSNSTSTGGGWKGRTD